jgi:hypothetical protein
MNLKVKYLGEIEVIFEMALGNESGNQVGSIHEKNRGRKSRETIPLSLGILFQDWRGGERTMTRPIISCTDGPSLA